MAPRFAYGMTPVGNPPASKYCWFKLRRIERCVPLVPTYSAVNTVCQGICRSTPRLHWSDRKSTRLNSSHGYISYAVFCLKKKKLVNRKALYRLILELSVLCSATYYLVIV